MYLRGIDCLRLLFTFPPSALSGTQLSAAKFVRAGTARSSTSTLLGLLQVVFGDPFLLVSASAGSCDGADGGANLSRSLLGLLLGGCERAVCVVSGSAKDGENNEVGG